MIENVCLQSFKLISLHLKVRAIYRNYFHFYKFVDLNQPVISVLERSNQYDDSDVRIEDKIEDKF